MAWTKVIGTVEFSVENGRTIVVIKSTKVQPVDPPEETMLYQSGWGDSSVLLVTSVLSLRNFE